MKKLLFIAGIFVLFSLSAYGQIQKYQTEIDLSLKEFQYQDFSISFFTHSGEFKEQTYMSKLICPEVQIMEHRRFRPKRKVETSSELIYEDITAEEAMGRFVSEIRKSGKDAFVELKVSSEYKLIKVGTQHHKVLGYRIEGVALNL